jgi:hypothetical protein
MESSGEAEPAMRIAPHDGSHPAPLRQCHLRFGWWALATFAALGLVLESLHALKAPFYVDAASETRRLLFTLAHAHGVLLSLVNLVWAVAGATAFAGRQRLATAASRCLRAATVLLPGGFLIGGARVYGGDPGIGIALVPAGGLLLLAALVLTARAASIAPAGSEPGL